MNDTARVERSRDRSLVHRTRRWLHWRRVALRITAARIRFALRVRRWLDDTPEPPSIGADGFGVSLDELDGYDADKAMGVRR